jgi:hypothetical protein
LPVTYTPSRASHAVKAYNINEGRNGELAGKCGKLKEYSDFIGKAGEP